MRPSAWPCSEPVCRSDPRSKPGAVAVEPGQRARDGVISGPAAGTARAMAGVLRLPAAGGQALQAGLQARSAALRGWAVRG